MGKQLKQWQTSFPWALKSLQMVTVAMKLKDACSLKEKLWPTYHIKKQRHYFADKGPSSQSYGFSSCHGWMWKLDHKESWAEKYWCSSTVMLEKTLESPLDCKEIQLVNAKEHSNYCTVQFSHSVVSNSLRPQGLQHTRLSCPSPTPRVCSNSCPLSQWCHPTILFSVIPFSSCLQSFPASGSFPICQLFKGGQSFGVSASASVLPMNTQDWSPLGWTGWISLQSKGLPRVFSNTTVQKHQLFGAQSSLWSNFHICTWLLEKP